MEVNGSEGLDEVAGESSWFGKKKERQTLIKKKDKESICREIERRRRRSTMRKDQNIEKEG